MRGVYPQIPENADLVMYWWYTAAELVRASKVKRFGFITTNSLRQSFNRSVVGPQMKAEPPVSLVFAIPDHPWVDASDGAAVRIAMSVGVRGVQTGDLLEVTSEHSKDDGAVEVSLRNTHGIINSDIRVGTDVKEGGALAANDSLCCVGYQLTGTGFTLSAADRASLLKADKIQAGTIIHPLLSARDITQEPRELFAIDLFGFTPAEIRNQFPAVFQWVLTRVKPERDSNSRASLRERWWIFGEPRSTFRPALTGLRRMIVAPLTSKHRLFTFCGTKTIGDSTTVLFAFDDAFYLGVLSSRIHCLFSLTAGGHLGVGNDPRYNKSVCFDPFPFPLCVEAERALIRKLAEELDAHRKRVQAQHGLTLTGLYNVLEKLRAAEAERGVHAASPSAVLKRPEVPHAASGSTSKRPEGRAPTVTLTPKEKLIHDQGLVSVLKQLHDDLDAAVFAAYGWPATLTDAEILERLVALNAERAAEEKRGVIHWLRPEYQTGKQKAESGKQKEMELPERKKERGPRPASTSKRPKVRAPKMAWPKPLPERVQAVEAALHAAAAPVSPAALAQRFARAQPADVAEILETLTAMGRARKQGENFTR